ncbi:phospholipase-like protein, partial [Tanacetum coccineum]
MPCSCDCRGMWDHRVRIGHTSNANSALNSINSLGNMISEVDIKNLTVKQYLMLTQENQAHGMVKNEYEGMMKKDIEDMTIAEYIDHDRNEDVDEWLNAEMEKSMRGQDKENEEDALIDILKSLVGECKSVYNNKNTRVEAPSCGTNKVQGVSFVAEDEEGDISGALPCQLPPKELNPKSFNLPCTIGNLNLYAMADLGANVNVMPKLIFEHLKLSSLKETSMVVEMADMIKKDPLGIDCEMWPTCNLDLSFCGGYDAIYGKGENGMLKQWMCFRDHKRQSVGANRMVFTNFLKLRYGNKVIEDTTHERRYYKWVVQDSEFNDNGVAQEATIDNNPYSFDVEIDYGKTLNDPYSRRFDEYKEKFDSEIEQLPNEYDLRVGFEEDEQWESGIEKTCYTPPFVKSET